jgi:Pvc16 N-terminal domain
MALFAHLHDVGQVMAEHIREQLGYVDVQAGEPRTITATTAPGIRLTLMFVTPQGSHRNDPWEREPTGERTPPPLSLSCFYLVTASGADSEDPIAAHNALGDVMRLFHTQPTLNLPLSDSFVASPPSAYTELGEGQLTLVQVPMLLEQIDKIWTSLEAALQPWALFEVGPVQLTSLEPERPPAPVVRPGGVAFIDVRAGLRPQILRVTPAAVRSQGRVRIDALLPGGVEQVMVDGIAVAPGPVLAAEPDGPLLLDLSAGGLEVLREGVHTVSVQAGRMVSARENLRIAPPDVAVVDAPAFGAFDPANDLLLTGANLGAASEAILWPDQGLASPAEVTTLPVTDVSDDSLRIAAIGSPPLIADIDRRGGLWRLAVRVGAHVYTPFVLLELAP